MAPVLADEASTLHGGAGGTLGGNVFVLPDFSIPSIAGEGAGANLKNAVNGLLAVGPLGAFSGSLVTGSVGPYTAEINLNGFATVAHGSGSLSQTLSGTGVLYIPGITTPAGTITLTTNSAVPSASSTIAGTGSNQAVAVPVNAGGAQNAWSAVQGTPNEFSLAGGGTFNGATNTAMAFGAIANTTGGAFLASGDLTGLVVTTSTNVDLVYTGGDLTFAASGAISPTASSQVYAGPSFRFLDQSYVTDTSVNVAEVAPIAPASFQFPLYTETTKDHLSATYLGGVIGASISTQLDNTWSMSVNGEGGLYWSRAELSTNESYKLSGGGPGAVTTQTVTNATTISNSRSALAYAARLQTVLSAAVSQNQQIHFGGNVEYLSGVPTISRATPAASVVTGGGTSTYTGPSTGGTPGIAWASMMNFGATLSFTGQF